ncbi:MAG: hypothetical protein U1F16_02660 [Turneriella sp.]
MEAQPQVFVGGTLPSHDLDGVGIAGFDDGSHLLQLLLGMGYDSRCVATTDRNPTVWAYMGAPSLLLSRDEHSILQSSVVFSVDPFTLTIPEDAPPLQLLKPQVERDIRLAEIYFWATQDPFEWEARLKFADGRELVCNRAGWSLWGAPVEFRIDLEVKVKNLKPRKQHEKTQAAEEFLTGVRPEFPYLLARGQYSPDPKMSERCFLFFRAAKHLVFIREAWLSPKEIQHALKHDNIVAGECDAMYMPAPVLVWATSSGGFSLYRNLKLLFRFLPDVLMINRHPLQHRVFSRSVITGIHVYLNHGWVECGVKLMLGERSLTLARNFEWAASADPTYDGFNLMADTSWATALGRALSEAIGCPYTADKDLQ